MEFNDTINKVFLLPQSDHPSTPSRLSGSNSALNLLSHSLNPDLSNVNPASLLESPSRTLRSQDQIFSPHIIALPLTSSRLSAIPRSVLSRAGATTTLLSEPIPTPHTSTFSASATLPLTAALALNSTLSPSLIHHQRQIINNPGADSISVLNDDKDSNTAAGVLSRVGSGVLQQRARALRDTFRAQHQSPRSQSGGIRRSYSLVSLLKPPNSDPINISNAHNSSFMSDLYDPSDVVCDASSGLENKPEERDTFVDHDTVEDNHVESEEEDHYHSEGRAMFNDSGYGNGRSNGSAFRYGDSRIPAPAYLYGMQVPPQQMQPLGMQPPGMHDRSAPYYPQPMYPYPPEGYYMPYHEPPPGYGYREPHPHPLMPHHSSYMYDRNMGQRARQPVSMAGKHDAIIGDIDDTGGDIDTPLRLDNQPRRPLYRQVPAAAFRPPPRQGRPDNYGGPVDNDDTRSIMSFASHQSLDQSMLQYEQTPISSARRYGGYDGRYIGGRYQAGGQVTDSSIRAETQTMDTGRSSRATSARTYASTTSRSNIARLAPTPSVTVTPAVILPAVLTPILQHTAITATLPIKTASPSVKQVHPHRTSQSSSVATIDKPVPIQYTPGPINTRSSRTPIAISTNVSNHDRNIETEEEDAFDSVFKSQFFNSVDQTLFGNETLSAPLFRTVGATGLLGKGDATSTAPVVVDSSFRSPRSVRGTPVLMAATPLRVALTNKESPAPHISDIRTRVLSNTTTTLREQANTPSTRYSAKSDLVVDSPSVAHLRSPSGRFGTVDLNGSAEAVGGCIVAGCSLPRQLRGYCCMHYPVDYPTKSALATPAAVTAIAPSLTHPFTPTRLQQFSSANHVKTPIPSVSTAPPTLATRVPAPVSAPTGSSRSNLPEPIRKMLTNIPVPSIVGARGCIPRANSAKMFPVSARTTAIVGVAPSSNIPASMRAATARIQQQLQQKPSTVANIALANPPIPYPSSAVPLATPVSQSGDTPRMVTRVGTPHTASTATLSNKPSSQSRTASSATVVVSGGGGYARKPKPVVIATPAISESAELPFAKTAEPSIQMPVLEAVLPGCSDLTSKKGVMTQIQVLPKSTPPQLVLNKNVKPWRKGMAKPSKKWERPIDMPASALNLVSEMAVSPRIRAVSAILSGRLDQHDVDDDEESRLRSSLARLNIRLDSLQSRPSPNTYGPISSGNLRDNSRGNGQNVVFENQPTLPNPILLTQDQWVQQQQLQFSAKLQHQHSYPTNTTDSTVQYLQATSGPQIVSQTPIVSAQYVPQQTLGPASTQSNYYQAQMSIRPMMHEQASPSLQPQYYVQPMPPAITVPLGRIPQQQLYPRDPSYVPAIIQPPPPYQAYPLQQSFVPPISNVATQFAARVIMPTAGVSAAYYSNATAAPTTSTTVVRPPQMRPTVQMLRPVVDVSRPTVSRPLTNTVPENESGIVRLNPEAVHLLLS